ncbi:MAG: cell wall hydrolase [Pseudomonadota bacterium]
MAASEFIAAAIAAFSVVPLTTATPQSAGADMQCVPAAAIRLLETGPAAREWHGTVVGPSDLSRPRVMLAGGCAGIAPHGVLTAMVEMLRDWIDGPGANLAGLIEPRGAVSVIALTDPADVDPLQKMIRLVIEDLREKDPQIDLDRKQLGCLQRALYFEARGEGSLGLAAVAHVALNRVGTRPNRTSVCEVVREPGQFAPYLSGEPEAAELAQGDEEATRLAIETAAQVMAGYLPDPSRGGRYFYAPAVLKTQPAWAKGMKETARVGGHRFFVEPETRVARN